MSRFTLVTLALALVALVALAPAIAAAQPYKFTRPLTVVVWKGSLIEVYLNYTELADQYGLGPKGYQFALGIPGTAQPLTDQPLPILISDPAGTTFCTVGYIIIDIGSTNINYALWMTSSLNYTFTADIGTGVRATYMLFRSPAENDYLVHLYNVTGNSEVGTLNIYAKVYFPDKGSLEAAIKAANDGTVPPACQDLIDRWCANGCWLPVYGVIVPEDLPLTPGNRYSLLIKTTASTTWAFEGGLYVQAMEPNEILVKFDAGTSNVLAFGRKTPQKITLADGSNIYAVGALNVTINWTVLRSAIENSLSENLGVRNVSAVVRVVYRPSIYSLGQILAESGIVTYSSTSMNYTAAGSLLTNASAGSLPARILGGEFGTFNKSNVGAIIFNLTVNPDATLPIVNKMLALKYSVGGMTIMLPAAEGSVDIVVRVNETVCVGGCVTFDVVGISGATEAVPFWAIAAYIPLGYKITILPSAIYADDMRLDTPDDLVNGFNASLYGDRDALNVYDELRVVLVNFISDMTKFYLPAGTYTILGAGTPNIDRNVTALEALLIKWATGDVVGSTYVNETEGYIAAGNKLAYNRILVIYNVKPAPYAGAYYYLLPVFKLNLTDAEGQITTEVIATLPPINVTNVDNVASGDVKMVSGNTVFRIRPVLFAWPVDVISGSRLTSDTSTVATLGTYIMVYGVGFDLDDAALKLFVGNVSIPFSQLRKILGYQLLRADFIDVVVVNKETGTFGVLVPLWRLYEQGYDVLAGAKTGYITINVTGTGANSDVAGGHGNLGVYTGAAYDAAARYEIVEPAEPLVLLEPRAYINLTGSTATIAGNVTLTVATPDVNVLAYLQDGTIYRNKTAGAAYEKLVSLYPPADNNAMYYNFTHLMAVVITKPATADTTYALVLASGTTPVAFAINMTVSDLASGIYVARGIPVPTVKKGTYILAFYNESATTPVTGTGARIRMVPSVVFHSVEMGVADMSTVAWWTSGIYAPSLDALPNGTIMMYGYSWDTGYAIKLYVDQTQKMTIETAQIDETGSWTASYTVPATAAGSTLTLELDQNGQKAGAYVRVIEIKRNALVAKVSSGPVVYEDGTVKIPVVVTVTYYDVPVACNADVKISVKAYYDVKKHLAYSLDLTPADCVEPGVWMGVIEIPVIQAPTYLVIVAKVEYTLMGVAKLTQFAEAGVTIDPELKAMVATAAEKADTAAMAAEEVKTLVETLNTKVDSIATTVEGIDTKLASIAAKLDTIGTSLSDIAAKLDDIKTSLTSAVAEITTKLDKISGDLESVKATLAGITSEVSTAVKEALAGVATVDDVKSIVESAKNAILDKLAASTSDVKAAVAAAKSELARKIDESTAAVTSAVDAAVNKILGKVDEVAAAITDLKNSMATKSDVEAVKTAVDQLSSKLDEVKGAITASVEDVKKAVNSLAAKLGDVKAGVDSLKTEISNVKNSVDSVGTNTMIFGAASLVISIIVLALLILVAVKGGLLASH
ncbi:hypothetical protein [Pyrolobus fumarii]|nr:hypothetical protein [Pyrolobus fumarii]